MPRRQDLALSALLAAWLVLSVITIWLRPLWPIDETRYLGVAWEMWQRKDFIVPYLNGEPYSHKPPMLFWLMHLGWALFGVNEWWPRLISPLLALCTVPVVRRIAWRLWPAEVKRANNSVWILFGGLLFAVGLGLTMFDMLLTLLVATAVLGILQAAQGGRRGLVLLAAGIGFGLLAKGPVVLLHVLPVALLAPWWQPALRQRLTAWYAGIGLAVVGGAIVALAWVIPAIGAGGADYREAILWRQTAGRIVESFAHQRPAYFYLLLLPLALFPWSLWPSFWRGLTKAARTENLRFFWAWLAPVFVGFSLVSGKQAHYLLPLMPAFALLISLALANLPANDRRGDLWLVALVPAAVGALLLLHTRMPVGGDWPAWTTELPAWSAWLLLLLAVCVTALGRGSARHRMRVLSFATLALLAVIIAGPGRWMAPFYDSQPTAGELSVLQREGVQLAFFDKYHGQFNFAGRLEKPVLSIPPHEALAWSGSQPDAVLVVVAKERNDGRQPGPQSERPYRGGWLQVWTARDWAASQGHEKPRATGAGLIPQ